MNKQQKIRVRLDEKRDYRLAKMLHTDAQEEGYTVADMVIARIVATKALDLLDHPASIY